jgi:hypothetical protein
MIATAFDAAWGTAIATAGALSAIASAAWATRANARLVKRVKELEAAVRVVPLSSSPSFDVFLAHASSDAGLAHELSDALQDRGLRVWDADHALMIGDNLVQRVADGLARSDHGVVLISRAFMEAQWPQRELRVLSTLDREGRSRILPIWVDVDARDVSRFSPQLVDKLALRTQDRTVDEMAGLIAEAITLDEPASESGEPETPADR